MGTGIQTTAEIDKFMSLVDERVFLLFDTGHAWYSEGGEAPMLATVSYTHLSLRRSRKAGAARMDAG